MPGSAPRAIRATAYEPGTYHLDLGLEIFDWLEVVDFGDAYCPHGQTEVSHANIRERVHAAAPAYDHAELTVNAAHRVVFEALAGMAARRRDATQTPAGPPAR